jgi:undecaprenyl pyrophosphate phosphatase UppP
MPSKFLVRLEAGIACVAGALGILTAFWHDWIEALTGWDPDHHNGSVEWLIVLVLLVIAVSLGLLARHHRRLLMIPSEPRV